MDGWMDKWKEGYRWMDEWVWKSKKGLSYLGRNYKENDLKGKIIYFKLAGGLSY